MTAGMEETHCPLPDLKLGKCERLNTEQLCDEPPRSKKRINHKSIMKGIFAHDKTGNSGTCGHTRADACRTDQSERLQCCIGDARIDLGLTAPEP